MSDFNFDNELQKIIASKELVEVNLVGNDERSTAYLLGFNEEYIVLARITNDATLAGVTIALMDDFESIQTNTRFCQFLEKKLSGGGVYNEAKAFIDKVKKLSFEGFVAVFYDTDVLVDIRTASSVFTGKILNADSSVLFMDEIYIEENTPFAKTYINPSTITSITVGGSWLKLLSSSE